MAVAERIIRCDCCRRVLFKELPDGTLLIVARHDRETHETTYKPQAKR